MAKVRMESIPVAPDYQIKRGAIKAESGNGIRHVARAIFDTAGTDSAGVANTTIAAHGLGVYVPINAIVTNAWYDVPTTFVSAGADAGTIALGVQSATDLVAAIAISNASNVWDAGIRGTLVGMQALDGNALTAIANAAANAATCIKTTAERELTATVAGQVLTAGKLVLFVEYFISA